MKPCRKCGSTERFTSGGCKPCSLAYQRIKRVVNADSIKANRDRWRNENKDKIREQKSVWLEKNKEKMDIWFAKWHEENRERIRANAHMKRKFKSETERHFTPTDVMRKFIAQQGACQYCKVDVVDDYHIDHIIPVSKGGTNDAKNIQILCPTCNRKKHATLEADFLRYFPKVRVEKSVECVSGFFKSAGQKCVSLFSRVRGKSACP